MLRDPKVCQSPVRSGALRRAGRAGRKGTQWETGVTTTRDPKEVKQLQDAIDMPMQDITHSAAGLLPTFEQVCTPLRRCGTCARLHTCCCCCM